MFWMVNSKRDYLFSDKLEFTVMLGQVVGGFWTGLASGDNHSYSFPQGASPNLPAFIGVSRMSTNDVTFVWNYSLSY